MRKVAFFAAVLVAASAFATQVESGEVRLTPQMERIQRGLVERASLLLERYGTTFYALGMYLTAGSELREVVPRKSALLKPALVADSLRSAVREFYTAEASVVGIAVDLPGKEAMQIELEDLSGRCRLVRRSYKFARNGTVMFLAPEISSCEPSMLSEGGGRQRNSILRNGCVLTTRCRRTHSTRFARSGPLSSAVRPHRYSKAGYRSPFMELKGTSHVLLAAIPLVSLFAKQLRQLASSAWQGDV
jgi:hypothetical protein